MVTIIKGPTKKERREFTCFKCGTIYQADQWDYEYWNPNGKWGYRIPCPVCKDASWHFETNDFHKSWELPKYANVRYIKDEEE